MVKKTLFVGVFAYLIGNWSSLSRIVFESFAGLGLKASGTSLFETDSYVLDGSRKSASMPVSPSFSRSPA